MGVRVRSRTLAWHARKLPGLSKAREWGSSRSTVVPEGPQVLGRLVDRRVRLALAVRTPRAEPDSRRFSWGAAWAIAPRPLSG